MQSKKLILILSFFILVFPIFSGCLFDNILSTQSSYELKSWKIVENQGFASLSLNFESKEKLYLKTYNSNGELLDWEFFYGSDNTSLNIARYRETLSSDSISLKVFDSDKKLIEGKTKSFKVNGPKLNITTMGYNVWKSENKNSLIEVEILFYNNGDYPAFPETLKISYNNKEYIGFILPCSVLPGQYIKSYSFIYIGEITFNEKFNIEILDKNSKILLKEEMKFDNIDFCETTTYTDGIDKPLSVPIPENLFSYYDNRNELIVDDYAAFVFDKFDDDYLSLFLDLFIDNLDFSEYFYDQTDPEKINQIASFVQYLEYIPDYEENEEEIEDPQYPIETLFRRKDNCGGGDCEDKAILIASLLKKIGYNVSLIRIPDHMAVGVNLSEDALNEEYYVKNYYFLDTSPQKLGKVFNKYKTPSTLDVYSVNNRPFIDHYWKNRSNSSLTIYKESSGKRIIKVVLYIDNLGAMSGKDLDVNAVFYSNGNLELKKETTKILKLKPYTRAKATIEIDIPYGVSCWFDTRIYIDDKLVSKKTSKNKFTSY